MDKKVNTPRKKVAVWRYNHAKYSNKSYIDLTKVVAIDELEEGMRFSMSISTMRYGVLRHVVTWNFLMLGWQYDVFEL